jgi:hypothetical protein
MSAFGEGSVVESQVQFVCELMMLYVFRCIPFTTCKCETKRKTVAECKSFRVPSTKRTRLASKITRVSQAIQMCKSNLDENATKR